MNQLSNKIGSWKQLATDAKKYPRLVETAMKLSVFENTPLPIPDFVTSAPERQCPVEPSRPLVKSEVIQTAPSGIHKLYNVLIFTDQLVILPAEEGLSDIAFEKGWRIVHPNLYHHETQRYVNRFGAIEMDGATFYETFLQDIEMNEDSSEFFGDIIRPIYEAEENHGPDADEEEIDVEFADDETEEKEIEK